MYYEMPPAVVRFDSSQVARDRSFGHGLFRSAVYEPTEQERREYAALLADLEEQGRFRAIVEAVNGGCDLNPSAFNDADLIAAGLAAG